MEYPKDCSARKIGNKAEAIVNLAFIDLDFEYRKETGNDVGRDCVLELIEDEEFRNDKIEAQIKGTTNIDKYKIFNETAISFSLKISTINYALNSRE